MFNSLYRSIQMIWRMLKNAFLRPFRVLLAKFRRSTNLTRQMSKMVPSLVKSVTTAKVRPTSREDYVDAGKVYIAKSLLFILIGAGVALWLLGQFLIWPWMESQWFTARLYNQEEKADTHSGKVRLYYDAEKVNLAFEGRLEKGIKTGKGKMFHENGVASFVGLFADGLLTGNGIAYDTDANVLYEGGFAAGLYDGAGKLYQDNQLLYDGDFAQGMYHGKGKLYENGLIAYEGDFIFGSQTGKGKAYENGVLCYEGEVTDGLYTGAGKTYYANGVLSAQCLAFSMGLLDGQCQTFYETGTKKYEGTYVQGQAAGQGTRFDKDGNKLYVGNFAAGFYEGQGTQYYPSGAKQYEGGFSAEAYEGEGKLYDEKGLLVYEGGFSQGKYAGEGTLMLDNGMRAQGTFVAGELSGIASYFKGQTLFFEGLLEKGLAQGAGILHDAKGKPVYTGNFTKGFIDGAALMDMPVTDVREGVFAGATLVESVDAQGFIIQNPALQAAVFCNYGYDDAQIVVHRVFLYGNGLIPCFADGQFVVPPGYTKTTQGNEQPTLLAGVTATQARHAYTRYAYEDYSLRVWTDKSGAVILVEWRSPRDLTIATQPIVDSEGAMMDAMLDELGLGGEPE